MGYTKYKHQLKVGAKIESEHKDVIRILKRYIKKHHKLPSNAFIFRGIARSHLKEDRNYYTKLKKARL